MSPPIIAVTIHILHRHLLSSLYHTAIQSPMLRLVVFVYMYVCLSWSISQKPYSQTSPNFPCMLPEVVAGAIFLILQVKMPIAYR